MAGTLPAGFDDLLCDHTDAIAALTRDLRDAILRARPELSERVYKGWHGLGFHHPVRGYVGALFPRDGDVMMGFEWGANLPDPHGLLQGAGRRLRYLRFTPADGPPTPEHLVEYLDLAVES